MTESISVHWLNNALLEEIYRHHYKEEALKVLDHKLSRVSGVGDNYSSEMYRISVTLDRGPLGQITKNVIVKTMPNNEYLRVHVEQTNSFGKETEMLQIIIPEMEKILEEVGESRKLAAEIIYVLKDPEIAIFMEDLSVENFVIADRFNGLDFDHCKILLEYLADFHAASQVAIDRHPQWKETFQSTMWTSGEGSSKFLNETFDIFKELLPKWTENELYIREMEKIESAADSVCEIMKSGKSFKVQVLNHGDLWTNNIMFRYKQDHLEALRFVDLQLSHVNSPVIDLLYFLFISPRDDIRITKLNDFLEIYSNRWTFIAGKLGIPDYGLENLRNDFFKCLFFGFSMLYSVFPVVAAPPGDVVIGDPEDEEVVSQRVKVFQNKRIKRGLLDAIPLIIQNKAVG